MTAEFWQEQNDRLTQHFCADAQLFRLMNSANIKLAGSKVLEIGYAANRGADAAECFKRGAKNVDVLDGSLVAVQDVSVASAINRIKHFIDLKPIPIIGPYDIIYSRDTICYLSDDVIEHLLVSLNSNMTNNGSIILQYIIGFFKHTDGFVVNNMIDLDAPVDPSIVLHADNNIRLLTQSSLITLCRKAGLYISGSKTAVNTQGESETISRVDKYLCIKKTQ